MRVKLLIFGREAENRVQPRKNAYVLFKDVDGDAGSDNGQKVSYNLAQSHLIFLHIKPVSC